MSETTLNKNIFNISAPLKVNMLWGKKEQNVNLIWKMYDLHHSVVWKLQC